MFRRLRPADLEGVAKLAGIPFRRVSKADGTQQALQSALGKPGPTLIEVDVSSIGSIPPYFPYDQKPKAA